MRVAICNPQNTSGKDKNNMSLPNDNNNTLVLSYIGEDCWSRPVYQDQFKQLWKDIELGNGEMPCLYSVTGNEFDGEPDWPINQTFIIQPTENKVSQEKKFQYQMLDRLRCDCDYYLGYGHRNPRNLWAKDEKEHIGHMKSIWLSFSEEEKPEWLTWEQILEYEKAMCII